MLINIKKNISNLIRRFFNIIEFAREKIKELYAKVLAVYMENERFPIKETFDSKPQFYAATKKANEVMGYSYYKMFKINFVFMRFYSLWTLGKTRFIDI